ncbi:hypothetical protein [Nocardioides sp. NPDC006273]|uniref:hypothetical protein n=1 Tax=Nocardioides sp. NPDC006273 TaxID=3155598 RepID=UPI0033B42742
MADLADDIKVEVQLPPEEGDNLLTNTSGQYGAWQWAPDSLTTNVTITGDPVARTIKLQRGGTAGSTGIWTDPLPVTPGMYANARVDLTAITTGHKVTLGLQFYNSAYQVISWHYSSPSTALDTLAFSSVTIPGTAAYARLFVVLDKTADPNPDTGSANANALATFTKAMVTEVTGAGLPSVVRTNLMPNGGFQYSTTGWTVGQNIASISRFEYVGGAWVLRADTSETTLSNGEGCYVHGPYVSDIVGGENYSLRVDVRVDVMTDGHTLEPTMYYCWYNDSNAQIGSCTFVDSGVTDGSWVQFWRIITAPAGATKLRINPGMRHRGPPILVAAGWDFDVDSVSVVQSSALMPYWDGDTADTSSHVYDWTGTAGNSPSTRSSVGAVEYVEPDEQFIDVTGGYNQFTIERDELDISTMNGIVVDPALSPARADSMIKPGRGIRVWAYRPETEAFERLFTGKLGPCSVEYDPLEDEKRNKLKITVTSTGRESTLAQASRPGVALTAAGLPALALSSAGVPWVVDGSTAITPATSVADNESASALDQVALTRDTVGGTAWIDPTGTLQFETTLGAKSTGPDTMGPADYSAAGLKVGFSTDNLINQVLVTRLIRASDGSTEERTAGQTYEDGASVREWGAHSYPLTIASTPGATSDAEVAAQRILDGNATPTLAIEQVEVNSADERTHAFHDLYDLVTVTADTIDGEVIKALRIARRKDEFTTEKRPGGQGRWRTTYGFKVEGVVASPSIQPPLSSGAPSAARGTVTTYISTAASVPTGGWATTPGFSTVLDSASDTAALADLGCSYSSGVITVTTAGFLTIGIRYRAGATVAGLFAARLLVNGTSAKEIVDPSWNTNCTIEAELTRHFDANDQITMQIYNNTGASRALNTGSTGTSFCVTRY